MKKGLFKSLVTRLFWGSILFLPFLLSAEVQGEAVTSIRLALPALPDPVVTKIAGVFTRLVQSRCGATVLTEGTAPLTVELVVEAGIGAEGFQISDVSSGVIHIRGNDNRGLLYGVGKFLHTSAYDTTGFTAGSWRGTSIPACPVRGIYLATHFNNFYHVAPVEEVTNYIEDLSLWGANSFLVWFGREVYTSINDPAAQAQLVRLRALLQIVKDLGLNASMGCICNDGYKDGPVELRADDSTVNHEHYHTLNGPRIYNIGVELCPSKPGVPEMEIGYVQEMIDAFQSVGLDYWFFAPYDNGGCTCAQCAPWGSNGYLRMAELLVGAYRSAYPQGKVIMSTWYFNRWAYGEWEGITEQFNQQRPDWVDYLMIDNFEDYPAYPLEHGVPGGLPAVNFPDISMWGQDPWGGYGANPMPGRLQQRWDQTKHILSGGFPYSEGIYEDINKVICSQLYWAPDKPTMDTVGEYIAFEFSPAVVDAVKSAVDIFQQNHWRNQIGASAVTAYQLLEQAEANMTGQARCGWRWRLFRIRAALDQELYRNTLNQGRQSVFNAAYEELVAILYAENTWPMLRPVLIQAVGPAPAPVGLMGHWKLDTNPNMDPPPADPNVFLTALDEVGPGSHNGTLTNGPVWAAGQAAGSFALDFDGTDDFVDMGGVTTLGIGTGNASLAVWAKFDDPQLDTVLGPAVAVLAGKGHLRDGSGHGLHILDNKVGYQVRLMGGATINIYSNTVLNDGAWHHLGGVLERGKTNGVRLYVDGVLQSQTGDSTVFGASNLNDDSLFYVGARSWPAEVRRFHFNGQIDEVQLYDIALTQENIDYLYAHPGEAIKLVCGDWGFLDRDFDRNCYVDLADFAAFMSQWLDCTDPADPVHCVSAYQ